MLAASGGLRAWLGAIAVLVLTATLVALDLSVASVHQYWSHHTFTSSVLSGVLVLLLTVLIADRVTRLRQHRNQARAIAAQAAVLVAQARRTADAIGVATDSPDGREAAADEMRTYGLMLLTSAPLLIDIAPARSFLEAAQRVALQLARTLRAAGGPPVSIRIDDELEVLRSAAAPLLSALNPAERTAVDSNPGG